MKWLKELLEKHNVSEEVVTSITKETEDRQYVPKSRLDQEIEKRKGLESELTSRDTQITELKASVKGNEELSGKIAELEKQNGDWSAKYKSAMLDNAIKLSVKDAHSVEDVMHFIRRDGLELQEDGSVKGLEDVLKSVRESKPYLFVQETLGGRTPHVGGGTPPTVTKEQFNTMSYRERVELLQTNETLYNQLNS